MLLVAGTSSDVRTESEVAGVAGTARELDMKYQSAAAMKEDIDRFLKRPADPFKKTEPLPTPAGEPIGSRGGR